MFGPERREGEYAQSKGMGEPGNGARDAARELAAQGLQAGGISDAV